jgi:hypothetical protein
MAWRWEYHVFYPIFLNNETIESIHDWGTKKECLSFYGLEMTTLDFCLSYIIIIVIDYYMPIGKMTCIIKSIRII